MKKELIALLFACMLPASASLVSAKGIVTYTDEYYHITEKGEVNEKRIKEVRKTHYSEKGDFISGTRKINHTIHPLGAQHDPYHSISHIKPEDLVVRDSEGKITERIEVIEGGNILHRYLYNDHGDVIEEKRIADGMHGKTTTCFTYEYTYLGKHTFATNEEGVTAVSGYVNDPKARWVKRTVKRDGKVIEAINRRISSK